MSTDLPASGTPYYVLNELGEAEALAGHDLIVAALRSGGSLPECEAAGSAHVEKGCARP